MENERTSTGKSACEDQTHSDSDHEFRTESPIPTLASGFLELPPPYTPSPSQPIITQPQATDENEIWVPLLPPNCPRGLEYLSRVDQLLVHPQIELAKDRITFQTRNKYKIGNTSGQMVYFAAEDSNRCSRSCCGRLRPFDTKIFDDNKIEIIHFYRPLACQRCCCPCCLQSIEVSAPPGNAIGSVVQEWNIFYPTFAVKNANGDTMFRIEGPFFNFNCGQDVNFKITNSDGNEEVGKITKLSYGFVGEAYTKVDNFSISFPMDLDVRMKTVLLSGYDVLWDKAK